MKPRVLLVEDESAIADTIFFALRTEGFEVDWAPTGTEALEAAAENPPALVILDVGLPDCNGFDLFRDIQKGGSVPVIFLTARSDEVDRVAGLELGADDYVVKPFSPRELSARVRAVLRRAGQNARTGEDPPAGPGRCPFTVDVARRRILFRGVPVDLSRYEYRILKTLVGHPGWVYSREQLMDMAWDEPEASFERTVDSHIKNLRSKLRALEPGCDPIVTHRGQGYSLKEDW
jgi:two-component system catabolic regulation response regulator CreB